MPESMKNVRENQLKRVIYMTSDEFEDLLSEFGLKAEFSYNGISIYNPTGETDYNAETLNELLSDYFGVTVTSVHIDDCDYIGVWIVYTESERAITRVDIVDNDYSSEDPKRILQTYYLVNPDEEKLKLLQSRIKKRYEDGEDDDAMMDFGDVLDYIDNNFTQETIKSCTVEW